ncbi:PhoH family protein [Hallella mizrahii]|uniref:PhoH-like protein n=1 Tax=Hallella mizrahii TaxID=2606637 RepID=A0A7K0KD10_9BACT|nr:PhoH family protein [Hallella mizrahii]MST83335.1 phosphate starvation-inducible protein PhoH [Hallella mizrahii]
MIEKHIVLEDIDPVVFYGVNNAHLQMLKALFPKLRIVARDNVVRVLGDEEDMARFEEDIEKMRKHVVKYNSITDEDILDIIKGRQTKADAVKDVLVYSISGRPIKSRSENQQQLIDAFNKSDMIFAVGPAGTGKTYLSIALAVKALKEKAVKRIILSRPAVEAGEKLGFLPGDMKDKIDPYLQPLYDALQDMLPATRLSDLMEKHIIQIAPLAFMRGRTLSDAVVILDEAQNTTTAQIRMFLTRMGWNTKMIITGDMTQIDLPKECRSGLKEALKILKGVEGISVIELTKKDIVRHQLVTRIVNAYEAYDKHQEEEHRKRVEKQRRDSLENNDDEQELTIIGTGNFTEN